MSATDELRRLLDERGIEWNKPHVGNNKQWTFWSGADGLDFVANEDACGHVWLGMSLTPAQAVEATLGRGTCTMVVDNHHRVDAVETTWGCVCSACGGFHKFNHGEKWAFCPSCGREVVDG